MTKKFKSQLYLHCESFSGVEIFKKKIEITDTPRTTWNTIIREAKEMIIGGDFFGDAEDLDPDTADFPLDATTVKEMGEVLSKALKEGKFVFPGVYLDEADNIVRGETLTLRIVIGAEMIPVAGEHFKKCWEMCHSAAGKKSEK